MKTSTFLIVTLAAAAVLAACEEERPAAAAPAAPAKKKEAPAAAPAASGANALAQYSYNPVGKRDPFRSPEEEFKANIAGSGPNVCNEPLCAWDLDQLTLVAVVTGDANPIAMVEDPQGRGFIVRRNTKMGKQGGKVTNILRDSITVTEYFQAPDGKVNANPVTVKLKADAALLPSMDLLTGKLIQ